MNKELILTITQHRKFGVIFIPFIIKPSKGSTFYSSIEKANIVNVKEIDNYQPVYAELVKFMNEYEDIAITGFFTKTKDTKKFIRNVDYDFVDEKIRPFIERRIAKINKILKYNDIRIFRQDRKLSHIYEEDEIKFRGKKYADAIFNFKRTKEGIQYFLTIKYEGKEISLYNKKIMVLTEKPCSIVLNENLFCFKDIDSKKLKPFFTKKYVAIPRQTEKTYFEKFIFNSIRQFEVKAEGFQIIENKNPCQTILYLQNDLLGKPTLLQKYNYEGKIILPNNPEQTMLTLEEKNDDYTFTKTTRQREREQQLNEQLRKFGLYSKDNIHFYHKKDSENQIYSLLNWINKNNSTLKKAGIELKQTFFETHYMLDDIKIDVNVKNEQDWFDIRGMVILGKFEIPFIRLRNNILKHIREYILPDNSIAILPEEWFSTYKELFLFAEKSDKSLKLNRIHFHLLNNELLDLKSKYAENIQQLFDKNLQKEIPVPKNLNAKMRPYQISGFNWLHLLQKNKFGACLADDMGLGKTLQTLALLLDAQNTKTQELPNNKEKEPSLFSNFEKKISPTNLIVMPASLIHNWRNEIKKFTPSLKTFVHSGQNRIKNIQTFNKIDIVLTTYGVVRNDYDFFKTFTFHYLILDESQIIKNPDSKIYKAILELNATHKLVLTGTPIENSLTDLWSQMNFINQGLLGSFSVFKSEFVTPIEKHNDEQKSKKLQNLINPFVLRRTKEQVAKDLPPKTEQIIWCEMSETQQKIYEKERALVRNTILENMGQQTIQKSAIFVLQALTKLRQIANHPALVRKESDSGKFEEVTRILLNILSENHKVLIFSSFVRHLKLYANYLDQEKIAYCMLTGQTQKREKIINDFQNNEAKKVFLISLKAGGAGLNLTAADYVFLLDPWWNPATENQALSRAHRIGQDKKVFVYRFISSNSIEEKIRNLQNKKNKLAELFINSNNPLKNIPAEEWKNLFD